MIPTSSHNVNRGKPSLTSILNTVLNSKITKRSEDVDVTNFSQIS